MSAKHNRTTFTAEQNIVLREAFSGNPSPSSNEIKELALQLNLSEVVVKTWFKNQRARLKKQQKKTLSEQAKPEEGEIAECSACPRNTSPDDSNCEAREACAPDDDLPQDLQQIKLHLLWPAILFDTDTLVKLYALPGEDDPDSFQKYLQPGKEAQALNVSTLETDVEGSP